MQYICVVWGVEMKGTEETYMFMNINNYGNYVQNVCNINKGLKSETVLNQTRISAHVTPGNC